MEAKLETWKTERRRKELGRDQTPAESQKAFATSQITRLTNPVNKIYDTRI